MSLESEMRRQMEQAAAQQASGMGDESVNAAFAVRNKVVKLGKRRQPTKPKVSFRFTDARTARDTAKVSSPKRGFGSKM